MEDFNASRQLLTLYGLPMYQEDIPSIQRVLMAAFHAQAAVKEFPELRETVPITIVDKDLLV